MELAVPDTNECPEEVASRGQAIYDKQIRAKVESEHLGQFLVIDIHTGEYEIDESDAQATVRILAKRPNAVLYGLRIGHPTAYRLGGRFLV